MRTLTFNLRASSAVWGVLSNHRSEVAQVEAVCAWASQRWGHEIILFGSSAGAPIAGTVLPKVDVVTRYVGVGYTWGWLAAIAFGRHFGSILASEKVKSLLAVAHLLFHAPPFRTPVTWPRPHPRTCSRNFS